jgi:hypothetical protein
MACTDYTALDDPEFLAELQRVREEFENAGHPSLELTEKLMRLNEEFLRRASAAWGGER